MTSKLTDLNAGNDKTAKILELLHRVSLNGRADIPVDTQNAFATEAIVRLGFHHDWDVDATVQYYQEVYDSHELVIRAFDPKYFLEKSIGFFNLQNDEELQKLKKVSGFDNIDVQTVDEHYASAYEHTGPKIPEP